MYDVITVGSATVDCFAILKKDFTKIKHGEKVLIKDIDFHTGGGATNVGVGLSRLGIKTAFLGELGKDHSAHQILNQLRAEKVSIINRARSRHPTSYSIILDTEKTDRAILAYKGASNFLHYPDIPKSRLKTKWFYFASMVDTSFKTLEKIAAHAIRHNIKVYFNPSSYMACKGRRYLAKVLKAVNILCLNKEEAKALLKTKKSDIKFLLKGLYRLSQRMETVIITEGKHGLHAYDGKDINFLRPHKIPCTETTGAGDAFGTGFLAGMVMKQDIIFSLHLGLINSESVIQHIGAKTGLMKKREAFAKLRKHNVIK
ncbi:carbohydrate kinase family protein [Nanoarchaeota archaeon]